MKDITNIMAILFLTGCANNLYQDNSTSTTSTQTTTSSSSTTTSSTWSETTTSSTTTQTTTTTSQTTATTNTTITTTPVAGDCHAYDPLDVSDWSRIYDVTYNGQSGEEYNWGVGDIGGVYRVDVSMVAGTEGWSGSQYFDCDINGEGAFLTGWEMVVDTLISPKTLVADLSTARRYLPGEDEMGTVGSWSYSYNLNVSGLPFGTSTVPASGTFTEVGFETISVAAGDFDVYHIQNDYTIDWSAVDMGLGLGPGLVNGSADYYYAEGMGLVYELTVDSGTGDIILEKELSSYSGL